MKIIVYTNDNGLVSRFWPANGLSAEDLIAKVVPEYANDAEVIDESNVPSDETFKNAWVKQPSKVAVDLSKAKALAHEWRKNKRAIEFAPLDIKATIPSEAAEAEALRQVIRERYADIQEDIDAAFSVQVLKALLTDNSII